MITSGFSHESILMVLLGCCLEGHIYNGVSFVQHIIILSFSYHVKSPRSCLWISCLGTVNTGKIEPRAIKCIFILSLEPKGVQVLSPSMRKDGWGFIHIPPFSGDDNFGWINHMEGSFQIKGVSEVTMEGRAWVGWFQW